MQGMQSLGTEYEKLGTMRRERENESKCLRSDKCSYTVIGLNQVISRTFQVSSAPAAASARVLKHGYHPHVYVWWGLAP